MGDMVTSVAPSGLCPTLVSLTPSRLQVEKKPAEGEDMSKYNRVAHQLNLSRWVLLGFICVEVFTIVMAVLLRFVIKEEQPYDAFSEQTTEQRNTTLSNLARDIEKFASRSKAS